MLGVDFNREKTWLAPVARFTSLSPNEARTSYLTSLSAEDGTQTKQFLQNVSDILGRSRKRSLANSDRAGVFLDQISHAMCFAAVQSSEKPQDIWVRSQ